MRLELTDGEAELLGGILGRAAERFGDSTKLADMIACWEDLATRVGSGERSFQLTERQARYLRKACMGARSFLRKKSAEGGFLTRRAYRKQLVRHEPLFERVLGNE